LKFCKKWGRGVAGGLISISFKFITSVKMIADNKYENNLNFKTVRPLSSDERRKHRNREASRRYRERARQDPELLRKMREQQNSRQNKYYESLNTKKMNSGKGDN
jgi:hypothetical protein